VASIVAPGGGTTAVLYTDFVAAPVGAPLTVCGHWSGSPTVTIDNKAAPVLQASASLNPGYDCVRVTLTGAGVVAVNGVAGPSVAVQTGNLLYVSLKGDDATAAKNDPAKPWRHLQLSSAEASGAWGAAKPGDVIILRGGVYTDSAVDGAFARIWRQGGTAGAPISITSQPGEPVTINAPKRGGFNGGGEEAPQAKYIAISNLTIVGHPQGASDGAPVNLQTKGDSWRVVNNDVSWPVAPDGMKAGGIVGHGANPKILGNYIHDIAGGTLNHGVYIDGGSGAEIAWNEIAKVKSGNLFQSFDTFDDIGITNLSVHDNVLHDGGRYGLNVADQTISAAFVRNRITNTAYAGIRITVNTDDAPANLVFTDNSGTGWNLGGGPPGAVNCDWRLARGTALIEKSSIGAGAGAKEYVVNDGSCPVLKFSGITWSGLAGKAGP